MADTTSVSDKAAKEVGKDLAEWLVLSHSPEAELEFHEREPEKVIPAKNSDGADTPSGHALRVVGAPDPADAGSEKERQRGLHYRMEKFRKRWLG
jgi:hypothetical protein